MKKLILIGLLFASLSVKAVTLTVVITNGVFTNIPFLNPGPVRVSQFLVSGTSTNAGTNVAAIILVDTPTNNLTYTNLAFTNTLTYATNVTNFNTNYYGVTNAFTNIVLIDNTNNAVAATTNNWPQRLIIPIPTVPTLDIVGTVNYYFQNGLWITNTATNGAATLTLTYQQ